jgi:hypothetical protein
MIELTSLKNQGQSPQIYKEPENGPDIPKFPLIPLKFGSRHNPGIPKFNVEQDIQTPKISKEDEIAQNFACMITPMSQVKQKKFNDENIDEQDI